MGGLQKVKQLLRITAPHFVAGVVVGWRAADILAYMAHWTPERIYAYCRKHGWKVEDLGDE